MTSATMISTTLINAVDSSDYDCGYNFDYNSIDTISITGYDKMFNIQPENGLLVSGDAEVQGSLTVGGRDINQVLLNIEARLAILNPNPELEDKWELLKQLGQQYRQLEAEILEKEKILGILKK